MADAAVSQRPTFTTLAGSDFVYVVKGGVTGKMAVSDLQKIFGGSGTGSSTGSGTAGTKNLLRNPKDLSVYQDWFVYDSGAGTTKVISAQQISFPDEQKEHSFYQANTKTQIPNGTYTFGFTATRKAGSGGGRLRAQVYTEGESVHYSADDQTIQDGVAYRTYVTVTITDKATNTHFALDCINGGGIFDLSNITVVAGSIDNKDAA